MGDLFAAMKKRREAIDETNESKNTAEKNMGSKDWSDSDDDSKTISNTSFGK